MRRKKERCPLCSQPIRTRDRHAVMSLIMPKGLSEEQFTTAVNAATADEQRTPAEGVEHDAYIVAATLRLAEMPGFQDWNDEERVVAGRALLKAGGRIVMVHGHCYDRFQPSNEFITPAWAAFMEQAAG